MKLMQRNRHPRQRRAGLLLVAALALIGGACGDDDDDDAATDNAETDTTETTEEAGDGDTEAFCQGRVEIEQAFNAEQPDADAINDMLDEFEAAAPPDLAENVSAVAGALSTSAETGSDPAEDPEFIENVGPIDEFALTECGYETVEVTGVDYAFEGIPATLPSGTVGFKLTNDGAEPHDLAILRINDGVTMSVEEVLSLPEEQGMQNVTFAGAAFAEPGQSGVTFVELESGRYGVACFVPVGGAEDGPPHFTEGMFAEFEVA